MKRRVAYAFFCSLGLLLLTGCDIEPALNCSVEDFFESHLVNESSDLGTIRIHVDGTPSMQGYVTSGATVYTRTITFLLDMLDPQSDEQIIFYRLGPDTTEIKRGDYLRAQTEAFYGSGPEFPLLEVVRIEQALQVPANSNELTVIVTDLFQAQEDIAKILKPIEDSYLNPEFPERAVGVVGIKSEFNGTVFQEGIGEDAQEFQPYSTQGSPDKPFYLILLGEYASVVRQVDGLVERIGNETMVRATIFSPRYLYQEPFEQQLVNSETLRNQLGNSQQDARRISVPAQMRDARNIRVKNNVNGFQLFEIKRSRDDSPIMLSGEIAISRHPYSLSLNPEVLRVQTTAYDYDVDSEKFVVSSVNPSLSAALSFQSWEHDETQNRLRFEYSIDPAKLQNNQIHFFETVISPNLDTEAIFGHESWWMEWDRGENEDALWKTPNLDRFLQELAYLSQTAMREPSPELGRFCYAIKKAA